MEELRGDPEEVNAPDIHLHKLNNLIEELVNRCVPTREFYAKHSPAPWITQELKDIRRRETKLIDDLKEEQADYLERVFNRSGSSKQFWSQIDRLGLTVSSAKSKKPVKFDLRVLNDYYATVVHGTKLPPLETILRTLNQVQNGPTFRFEQATVPQVVKHLTNLSSNALGTDGLPTLALKNSSTC
ncbi:hypothetical protein KQX54_000569 [Cotesia glomerata]|uniref:Uncharacterized protein n=1 Tax=Cotesia glomerata TaxID=32391 RepID=A0AAV7I8F9_COTGL|nr:hypothetical protein KQX54_000569 [Cotesia glomerata]